MFYISDTLKNAAAKLETTFETMLDPGYEDQLKSEKEIEIYKNLLVELQMQQLHVTREYQKLFAEKEREITLLKSSETVRSEDAPSRTPDDSAADVPASPDGDEFVLKSEYDIKMKNNVIEKTEAIMETRVTKEIAQALKAKLVAYEQIIYEQKKQNDRIRVLEQALQARRSNADGNEALQKLTEAYAKLAGDTETQRQQYSRLFREKEELVSRVATQQHAIEMMSDPASAVVNDENMPASANVPKLDIGSMTKRVEKLESDLQEEQQRCVAKSTQVARLEAELAQAHESINTSTHDSDGALEEQADALARDFEEQKQLLRTIFEQEKEDALAALKSEMSNQPADDMPAADGPLLERVAELEQENRALTDKVESERLLLANAEESRGIAESKSASELAQLDATHSEQVAKLEASHRQALETLSESLTAAKSAELSNLEAEFQSQAEQKQQEHDRAVEDMLVAHQQELDESRKCASDHLEAELRRCAKEATALCEAHEQAIAEQEGNHTERIHALQASHMAATTAFESRLSSLESERETLSSSIESLRESHEQELGELRAAHLVERQGALAEQKERLELAQEAALEAMQADWRARVDEAQSQVESFKELYIKEAKLRKKVHNDLIDLRGNIRVYCRVRPMVEAEKQSNNLDDTAQVLNFPVDGELELRKTDGKLNRFEFDDVFPPNSTQTQVFQDVEPLVVSVMDGYNVCIFAYGQTGSGKTYTMEGPEHDRGVNFRALEQLFMVGQERRDNFSYEFKISVLEIYNEAVFDLLTQGKKESLDIKLNSSGKVHVKGLEQLPVECMDDVHKAMKRAHNNRSVGAHNMNEHSSRSHLVLTVTCSSTNRVNQSTTCGLLNLIDLAGSERIAKTDASGVRLKEAQNINKSLSALGDVISALGERKKGSHVPFRNSKLTHLLQPSLGGNSKVAMFVNISPVQYNASESLCSLNFAHRCRKVELGVARRNGGDAEAVQKYKKQVTELQQQISSMQRIGSVSSSTAGSLTPRKGKGRE